MQPKTLLLIGTVFCGANESTYLPEYHTNSQNHVQREAKKKIELCLKEAKVLILGNNSTSCMLLILCVDLNSIVHH